jgi:hypothetical protein
MHVIEIRVIIEGVSYLQLKNYPVLERTSDSLGPTRSRTIPAFSASDVEIYQN